MEEGRFKDLGSIFDGLLGGASSGNSGLRGLLGGVDWSKLGSNIKDWIPGSYHGLVDNALGWFDRFDPAGPDREIKCTGGRVWNDCGSMCTKTCTAPAPRCTKQCVPKCECPAAAPVWAKGECITAKQCDEDWEKDFDDKGTGKDEASTDLDPSKPLAQTLKGCECTGET